MKKIIIMTLVASFVISSLTGCGSDNNASTSNNTNSVQINTNDSNNNSNSNTDAVSNTSNVSQASTSDLFTDRDYEIDFDDSNYSTIDVSNTSGDIAGVSIVGDVFTITQEGTYLVTGTSTTAQIVIDVPDLEKVQLMLSNVNMTNSTTAPIYVKQADKVFITTEKGSTNTLSATLVEDETAETNIDGVIFSHDNITLNGAGVLNINATNGNGIVGKDDIKITSGEYNIVADKHGIEANDSIRIANGKYNIVAEKDGLHCENTDNVEKGYIYILDGTFDIDVQGDGLDSSSYIEIVAGEYNIMTGGGYANAPVKVAEPNTMGGGGGGGMMMRPAIATTSSVNAFDALQARGGQGNQGQGEMGEQGGMPPMMGEMGELPEGMEMPEDMMMGRPEMGEMPEGMEMPEDMMMGRPEMGEMAEGMEIPEDMMMGRPEMGEMAEGMERPDMMGQMGNVATTTTTTTEDDGISRKGIKATGNITIQSGTFNMDNYDDSFHANGNLLIRGGDYTVGTADDAFHADLNTKVEGGKIIIVNCHEGLEGQSIDVLGGYIDITCNDDGLNAASDVKENIYINIAGGEIYIDGTLESDGLDSNGNLTMSGGYVQISGTTDERDTVLDYDGDGSITGGTFIATGSASATIQNFDEDSTQGTILVTLTAWQEGKVTLTNSSGTVIAEVEPPKQYKAVTISTPEIKLGETYTLVAGDTTTEIEMDSLIYGTGNHSMGGRR